MTHIRYLATFVLLIATFFSSVFAMGDTPEAKPEKRIIESTDLCDPQEKSEVPLYY